MNQTSMKSQVGRSQSLAELVVERQEASFSATFPTSTLIKIFVLAGLLALMNHTQFLVLWRKWLDDPNWSHGFIIPLFSAYLLFIRRRELMSVPRKTNYVGLVLLVLAGLAQVAAYLIRTDWACQIAMLMMALGLVLYLAGWQMFKLVWLPILFLAFAMPIPGLLYERVSLPLQNLAATASAGLLKTGGVVIESAGSAMQMLTRGGNTQRLSVEEACSGVRLLMAFEALAVALAYLGDKPLWQRVTLVLLGIPVAIGCNILRVVITSLAFYVDKPEFGKDFMHEFTGMLMLIPAFCMLWLIGWILNGFSRVDEGDAEEEKGGGEVAG